MALCPVAALLVVGIDMARTSVLNRDAAQRPGINPVFVKKREA
jgi:hypothetical protein